MPPAWTVRLLPASVSPFDAMNGMPVIAGYCGAPRAPVKATTAGDRPGYDLVRRISHDLDHWSQDPAGAGRDATLGRARLEVGRAVREGAGRDAGRQHAHHRVHGALSALRRLGRRLLGHGRRGRPPARLPEQLHRADPRARARRDRRGGHAAARAGLVVPAADPGRGRARRAALRAPPLRRARALHQLGQRGGDDGDQGRAGLDRAAQDRQVRGRLPRLLRLRGGEPRLLPRELGQPGLARQHRLLARHAAGGAGGRRGAAVQPPGAGRRAHRARGDGPGRRPRRSDPEPGGADAGAPRAPSRAARRDERARHRAHLRRGHHVPGGLPGRAGRVRRHAGHDHARQDHRGRLPGGRGGRPRRRDGGLRPHRGPAGGAARRAPSTPTRSRWRPGSSRCGC